LSAIYEVCDRINRSENSESISKEAARAIRKQFKHGNEAERKAAARVWLFMMKNIQAPNFRRGYAESNQADIVAHAANKKMTSCLEPILLAPPTKPLVSAPTHTAITDILADLTYNYGQEKGCESLVELWKKVKLPQESEQVRSLNFLSLTFRESRSPRTTRRSNPRQCTQLACSTVPTARLQSRAPDPAPL
jgi:hypothetical protein